MSYFHPGQKLKRGQYEIIEILGRGGFRITYLAQYYKRKKQVAIKSLNIFFLQERYRDRIWKHRRFCRIFSRRQDKFNTEKILI